METAAPFQRRRPSSTTGKDVREEVAPPNRRRKRTWSHPHGKRWKHHHQTKGGGAPLPRMMGEREEENGTTTHHLEEEPKHLHQPKGGRNAALLSVVLPSPFFFPWLCCPSLLPGRSKLFYTDFRFRLQSDFFKKHAKFQNYKFKLHKFPTKTIIEFFTTFAWNFFDDVQNSI